MEVVRERLEATLDPQAERELFRALGERYRPLIADVSRSLHDALEIEPQGPPGGEAYLTRGGSVVYYLVAPDRRSLEAGGLLARPDERRAYAEFRDSIGHLVGRGEWSALSQRAERFALLREEARPLTFGPHELESAEFLERPQVRHLVRRIQAHPGITLQDAAGDRELPEVGAEVQELEERGLLSREYEVSSRKTGQRLLRVATLGALDEASRQGFRYDGRPLAEHRITQLLTLTEAGKRLARPNLWLALRLVRILRELGFSPEDMLWTEEQDLRILDLFASSVGALFVFEVEEQPVDAERAFRFLTRCRYYRPDEGFLVAPAGADREAHLVLRGDGPSLRICDDLGSLPGDLERVVRRSRFRYLERLLARFEPLTRIPVGEVVGEYFFREARVPAAPPPPPPAPPAERKAEAEAAPRPLEDFAPEVIPHLEFPAAEGTYHERLRETALRLVEELEKPRFTDRLEDLGDLLRELGEEDEACSALVADAEGLALLGTAEGDTLDLAAALQVEILEAFRRALGEGDLGEVESLVVEGRGSLSLYPVGGPQPGLALVALRRGGGAEGDEAEATSLSGGMALREAILKKALDGLGRLEGVRGNLVVERDGLPIDFQLEEGVDAELLGAMLSQALADCRKHLARLGLEPVRQVLVRTRGDLWYSLMPLGEEGLLITLLEAGTSPDVWQARLPQEAMMVASALQ